MRQIFKQPDSDKGFSNKSTMRKILSVTFLTLQLALSTPLGAQTVICDNGLKVRYGECPVDTPPDLPPQEVLIKVVGLGEGSIIFPPVIFEEFTRKVMVIKRRFDRTQRNGCIIRYTIVKIIGIYDGRGYKKGGVEKT